MATAQVAMVLIASIAGSAPVNANNCSGHCAGFCGADNQCYPYTSVNANNCSGTCDGFCGADNQCHQYTCQNWYEFGPHRFTGNAIVSPEPLTCQNIPATGAEISTVQFRCRDLSPRPIAMGFTRRCSANPNASSATNFTCYEMAANTDFQPFLLHVNVTGLTCNNNSPYDETGYPKFVYSVTVRSERPKSGEEWFLTSHNSTSEFNATLALTGAIYAVYTEKEIEATTTMATTTTHSSISLSNKKPPITIVGAFLATVLANFVF